MNASILHNHAISQTFSTMDKFVWPSILYRTILKNWSTLYDIQKDIIFVKNAFDKISLYQSKLTKV